MVFWRRLKTPVKEQLLLPASIRKDHEAFEREKQVQNWSRAKREALINGNRASLPGLAKKIFEKKK